MGIGGYINISQNAKQVIFNGTFTAGGLEVECANGELRIIKEGKHRKFIGRIEQISYNAAFAEKEGRTAIFVTERAVLRIVEGGLEVIEIAPGIDLERDVLGQMAFKPRVSSKLKLMDRSLFVPEPMGLARLIEPRLVEHR